MKLNNIFKACLIMGLSSPALASTYEQFIADVHQNSVAVKIATLTYQAEAERYQASINYFVPVVTASAEYEASYKTRLKNETNTLTVGATSTLYSSGSLHRIDEYDYKVQDAASNIALEKERLSAAVLKNLLNIHYYKYLKTFATQLNYDAIELSDKITLQFDNGTASQNDANRTQLLISQIENEINLIDKQIALSQSNIEGVTGIMFPTDGIDLADNMVKRIISFVQNENELHNNRNYLNLDLKRKAAYELAMQQDSLLNISLGAEGTWEAKGDNVWIADPTIKLTTGVNLFNYQQLQEKRAQLVAVESAKLNMDLKFIEIKNNFNTYQLLENSFIDELNNLATQVKQTESLIKGHQNEYIVGKVSLYEMLNTRFDLFTKMKQKTDVEIQFTQNKIDMMQNTGML